MAGDFAMEFIASFDRMIPFGRNGQTLLPLLIVVNNKLNERNFCGIFLLEGKLLLIFDSKIIIVSLPKKKRELQCKERNETWDETKKKRREKGEERKETVATHRKPRRVTIYRG